MPDLKPWQPRGKVVAGGLGAIVATFIASMLRETGVFDASPELVGGSSALFSVLFGYIKS